MENPVDFVKKTQILSPETENVPGDIIFAGIGYEKDAIGRATDVELSPGIKARVCSPEDLLSTRQFQKEKRTGRILKESS